MPIKKHPDGHRSIEAEVEVPGTPEEVWAAIATGPGISSWFVPASSDECVGGKTACDFGPGMESVAKITEWNPPHQFVAVTEEEPGTVATEWIVEARSGGTCIVRVVHRWFAESDEWDHQFEQHRWGWLSFFRILKLYLTRYRRQACAIGAISAMTTTSVKEAWRAVLDSLPSDGEGIQTFSTPSGLAVAEQAIDESFEELLLRIDEPVASIVHLFVMGMGEQTLLSVRVYTYGADAAVGAGEKAKWQAWADTLFPQPTGEPSEPTT